MGRSDLHIVHTRKVTTTNTSQGAHRRRGATAFALAVSVLAVATAAGCGSSEAGPPAKVSTPSNDSRYQSRVVRTTFTKPTGTFTDTNGESFNIKKQTAGHPTLLYFGYTHCPDVCPLTMASLAAAVEKLPAKQRENFRVVFITSDPHRDTPKRLRTWLDSFSKDFIGLTASWPTIRDAAKHVHVGLTKPKPTTGDYKVTHGAQVIGFAPDGNRAYMFPAKTPVEDYEHDLPLLAKGVRP